MSNKKVCLQTKTWIHMSNDIFYRCTSIMTFSLWHFHIHLQLQTLKYEQKLCMPDYAQHLWTLHASNNFATCIKCDDISTNWITTNIANLAILQNNHQESVELARQESIWIIFPVTESPKKAFCLPCVVSVPIAMHMNLYIRIQSWFIDRADNNFKIVASIIGLYFKYAERSPLFVIIGS